MIKDVIRNLQKASVRPNDFHSRYSELLDRLWQRKDNEIQARATADPTTSAPANNQPTGLGDGNGEYAATSMRNGGWYDGQQDEFSWLDLQAVGELVSGEPGFGAVDGYSSQFMNMGGDWGGDFWGFSLQASPKGSLDESKAGAMIGFLQRLLLSKSMLIIRVSDYIPPLLNQLRAEMGT